MVTFQDISQAIECLAPVDLQEKWDNTGWQICDNYNQECRGVLTCLDATQQAVDEAHRLRCNLIVSHHPLFYHGVKQLCNATAQQRRVAHLVKHDIALYSCHTALDSASKIGLSLFQGQALGLQNLKVLVPNDKYPHAGLGVIGDFDSSLPAPMVIEKVKEVYNSPIVRVAGLSQHQHIKKLALCTGGAGDFIENAVKAGADCYVTSDIRYHDFLDFQDFILLIDTCHYESEICASSILASIIKEQFPNLPVHPFEAEKSPVTYL